MNRKTNLNAATVEAIGQFRQATPLLAIAGQPREEDLAHLAAAGFEAVINLGLEYAEYALLDERSSSGQFGMAYVNIPVIWERPNFVQFEVFCEFLEAWRERKVFVHCAENKRASVFVALYLIIYRGLPSQESLRLVYEQWTPNGTWQAFIDKVLAERGASGAAHLLSGTYPAG